jgi:fluoride exporter
MFRNFLLVGAGGAVGSMARYGVSFVLSKFLSQPCQFASTFTINVVGSLIIGILFGLSARNQWLDQGGYLLLASGFCGGFTTFSTFALENVNLMQKGQSVMAFAYMTLSLVVGLVLCRVGIWLAG